MLALSSFLLLLACLLFATTWWGAYAEAPLRNELRAAPAPASCIPHVYTYLPYSIVGKPMSTTELSDSSTN